MNLTLGEFIRQSRDSKDLSLREMAKLLDCSPAFLSDIELGKRFPSDETFEKISNILKIKMSELEKYDMRSTVSEFKKVSQRDPGMVFAFRRAMDIKINSEDLIKFIELQHSKKRH